MNIRLYIKPYCPWCVKAIDWLDKKGLQYQTKDVIADATAYREMLALSGQTMAPMIDIDGAVLADFGPGELAKFWDRLEKQEGLV